MRGHRFDWLRLEKVAEEEVGEAQEMMLLTGICLRIARILSCLDSMPGDGLLHYYQHGSDGTIADLGKAPKIVVIHIHGHRIESCPYKAKKTN